MKNHYQALRISVFSQRVLIIGSAIISNICSFGQSNQRQYYPQVEPNDTNQGMAQYFFNARKNPFTGKMDYAAMASSEAAVAKFHISQKSHRSMSGLNLTWNFLGPDNVGGRTRAVLVDKNDPSGNTLFAGGVSGGIWKSTDGGSSWNSINDYMASLIVSCITQDVNGNIYFGTGEGFVLYGLGEGFSTGMIGGGVFKSTDDGATFTQLASTIPAFANTTGTNWAYVNRLAISSCNPNIIYAAIYGGLMVSPDAGATWHYAYNSATNKPLNFIGVYGGDVKIAADGSVVVADIDGTGYIAYPTCTSPFDTSFVRINSASVGGLPTGDRIEFAISPTNSNYIYASVVVSSGVPGKGLIGIYVSLNKGAYWYLIGPGGSLAFDPYSPGPGLPDEGTYANALAVYPANPGTILVGGVAIWSWAQSTATDTVGAWSSLTTINSYSNNVPFVYGGGGDPNYVHPDEQTLVFDVHNPNNVYAGTDVGIYKSTSAGATWGPINHNYNVTQFYNIDVAPYVNPANGEGLIGGTQNDGTPYIDGNVTPYYEDAVGMNLSDGGNAKISQIDPNLFFTTDDYGVALYRGSSLSKHTAPSLFYTRAVGLNEGANIDSIAELGFGASCFIQPLALYENVSDSNTIDSIRWVADSNYSAGHIVHLISPNGNVPFPYKLSNNVSKGDTIMVKNIVVAKIATGFSANNGVWICMQADDSTDPAIWMPIGGPLSTPDAFTGNDPVHCITWSPDGNTLFVGTEGGQLYRFSNLNAIRDSSYITGALGSIRSGAADIWITNPKCVVTSLKMTTAFAGRDILSISVDPTNGNNIMVTLGNYVGTSATYVYYCTNALAASPAFINETGNLPPMPVYSSILNVLGSGFPLSALIGTEHGVYSTTDITTHNWTEDVGGAPNTLTLAMKQQTLLPVLCNNSGNIYIGTHGRGGWYSGSIGPLSVQNVNASEPLSLKVYPNPSSGVFTFQVNNEPLNVRSIVEIYNMFGQRVYESALGGGIRQTANGENRIFNINLSGSAAGVYLYRVITETDNLIGEGKIILE